MTKHRVALLLAFALISAALCFQALSASSIVGQTGTNDILVNGQAVPWGTTLMAGSLLESPDRSSLVHLFDGRTLWLERGSRIRLREVEEGVAIHVEDGYLTFELGSGKAEVGPEGVLVVDRQGQVVGTTVGSTNVEQSGRKRGGGGKDDSDSDSDKDSDSEKPASRVKP